jgi:hybrid cluster-associated redox disulfide protein
MENKTEIKITKDMNLGEVVFKYPEAAEVLTDYGLSCVGCFASSFDTIEQGARIHELSEEELEDMLGRINEVVNYGE